MKTKKRNLTPKERKFITEYFKTGNAEQSAITAGYSKMTARKKSALWVGKSRQGASNKAIWDAVQAKREKLENENEATESRIIKEYERLAFFDIRKIYDAEGNLKKITDLDDNTAAALVGLNVLIKSNGVPDEASLLRKYKMGDKLKALDSLAKIKGMFAPEKKEVDANITIEIVEFGSGENQAAA